MAGERESYSDSGSRLESNVLVREAERWKKMLATEQNQLTWIFAES